MRHAGALLLLTVRFVVAVFIGGFRTVAIILRAGRGGDAAVVPGFVRVRFAPMSPRGAALLGCMVSLTPGSTLIDIDLVRRELLLHVLDASDTQAVVDGIRREFEPAFIVLFGEEVS